MLSEDVKTALNEELANQIKIALKGKGNSHDHAGL